MREKRCWSAGSPGGHGARDPIGLEERPREKTDESKQRREKRGMMEERGRETKREESARR